MFVKTVFQILKLKFLAYGMKQAFYLLHKQNLARVCNKKICLYKLSVWYLFSKPVCVNVALVNCNHGRKRLMLITYHPCICDHKYERWAGLTRLF